MSVLYSKDNKELIVTCDCKCEDSIHIVIDKDEDYYCFMSYMNGNFYSSQGGVFFTLKKKIKKIISIIFNKDYVYSDIIMTRETLKEFIDFLDSRR